MSHTPPSRLGDDGSHSEAGASYVFPSRESKSRTFYTTTQTAQSKFRLVAGVRAASVVDLSELMAPRQNYQFIPPSTRNFISPSGAGASLSSGRERHTLPAMGFLAGAQGQATGKEALRIEERRRRWRNQPRYTHMCPRLLGYTIAGRKIKKRKEQIQTWSEN